MPTDIYNPGAGIGAVLLVAGLIWMALASVELHHAKRGRVNIRLTLEKWSYWRFSAWAILVAVGILLIVKSPPLAIPMQIIVR